MYALDDGITSGNFNAADILWLIASIVFVIGALLPFRVKPLAVEWVVLMAGLALTAFGLFLT